MDKDNIDALVKEYRNTGDYGRKMLQSKHAELNFTQLMAEIMDESLSEQDEEIKSLQTMYANEQTDSVWPKILLVMSIIFVALSVIGSLVVASDFDGEIAFVIVLSTIITSLLFLGISMTLYVTHKNTVEILSRLDRDKD